MPNAAPDGKYADEPTIVRLCAAAAGLRFVKEGFAFTPEDDRLFALGWPHVRTVSAEHDDNDDPITPLKEMIDDEEERPYDIEWPLRVARRFVRALGSTEKRAQSSKIKAALAKGDEPLTQTEVRELLRNAVTRVGSNEEDLVENFVLLAEAMVGPETVLDAAVAAVETLPAPSWKQRNADAATMIFQLGFLLLRVSQAESDKQCARLEAVWKNIAVSGIPESEQTDGLDAVVNGADGAVRGGGRSRRMYAHVMTDPKLIAKVVDDSEFWPDVRFVHLGGEPVLASFAEQWNDYDAATFLAQLGRVRAPGVVDIVLAMCGSSDAKKAAKAWLKKHAEYAKPLLQKKLTGKGKEATWAKAALAELAKSKG